MTASDTESLIVTYHHAMESIIRTILRGHEGLFAANQARTYNGDEVRIVLKLAWPDNGDEGDENKFRYKYPELVCELEERGASVEQRKRVK